MKQVFITGAGGFIGGRLVEMLKERNSVEIHILLRTVAKAARISRYPLHYFRGNITDKESLREAMQGCDTVVHCAHDFVRPDANLLAAELIAEQCILQGVKRLVYISTFSIYKGDHEGGINEESPVALTGEYALNKLAVEKKLLQYYKEAGLPVIILRPTIVYGPFAGAWTVGTINELKETRKIVPYNGERICNTVYVDDVAQSIIKAMEADDQLNGNCYLVSGSSAVTWREFYASHQLPGMQEPVYWSKADSDLWYTKLITSTRPSVKHSLKTDPISYLKKTPLYSLYKYFLKSEKLKKKLLVSKKRIPKALNYPTKDTFETLSCKSQVDVSKIRRDLGFTPAYSFSEGMKKTLLWIEWANLNCSS